MSDKIKLEEFDKAVCLIFDIILDNLKRIASMSSLNFKAASIFSLLVKEGTHDKVKLVIIKNAENFIDQWSTFYQQSDQNWMHLKTISTELSLADVKPILQKRLLEYEEKFKEQFDLINLEAENYINLIASLDIPSTQKEDLLESLVLINGITYERTIKTWRWFFDGKNRR